MLGKKYNKLTVLRYAHTNKYGRKVYECVCDCGVIKEAENKYFGEYSYDNSMDPR